LFPTLPVLPVLRDNNTDYAEREAPLRKAMTNWNVTKPMTPGNYWGVCNNVVLFVRVDNQTAYDVHQTMYAKDYPISVDKFSYWIGPAHDGESKPKLPKGIFD